MRSSRSVIGIAASLLLVLLTGCSSSMSVRKVVSLDRFQRIYVERRLNDNHRLDELFVAELRRLGREASSGPMTMMPEKTDAVLTYDARWEWDFKTYVIELSFELHTAIPRKKLADARYHQPTIRTKSAEVVIRELLGQLLDNKSSPSPALRGETLRAPRDRAAAHATSWGVHLQG